MNNLDVESIWILASSWFRMILGSIASAWDEGPNGYLNLALDRYWGADRTRRVHPPKVLQPGKESFDLPSPSIAPQRATVLRPLRPGPPVRRNQFHAWRASSASNLSDS